MNKAFNKISYLLLISTFACFTAKSIPVEEIIIKSHNGAEPPVELIQANMKTKVGTEFDRSLLAEDIEQLAKTGFFKDNIEVDIQKATSGNVKLIVIIQEKSIIRNIQFSGNDLKSDKKLKRKLALEEGLHLDEKTLSEDKNAILTEYTNSGYYETQVATEIIPADNNRVDLTFVITETHRYKIDDVEFAGNTVFSNRKLRKKMLTKPSFWSFLFNTGYLDEDKLALDREQLTDMYAGAGYLDFKITDIEREYSDNGKWISLILKIDEGEAYSVTEIKTEGNKLFSDGELDHFTKLHQNDIYSRTTERNDIERIRREYENLGYVDVSVYADRDINPAAKDLSVTYRIAEGGPSTVRNIYINGNEITKDHVIRRELSLHPGDLCDGTQLKASKARLQNLNYFETVDVTHVDTETEGEKDINISVNEKRTGQLMIGAGFSTEDSLMGTLEISQTNFDINNWPRFTGGGQRMRMKLLVGSEKNELLLAFTEPWWLDRRLRLDLEAFHNTRDQGEYDQKTTGASIRVTRAWKKFWRQSISLRPQRISLDDFDDDIGILLAAEEDDYNAHTISFSLNRDSRDSFRYPTRGSQFNLTLDLESELWGAYSDIYRLEVSGTKYFPMIKGMVLKLHGEIGVVDEISNGDDPVAIFDRFFTGGSGSIRGFDRREIGPIDSAAYENPIGGKTKVVTGAELIYPIFETVRGSIFVDAGNVWEDAYDFGASDFTVTVGLGLSLQLPIGPLRFDYGIPVKKGWDHLDSGGKLHFNISF